MSKGAEIPYPGPVENLNVNVLTPDEVILSWEPPSATNGILESYAIDCLGTKHVSYIFNLVHMHYLEV